MKSIYAVIIVLLVANLVATLWFGTKNNAPEVNQQGSANSLPDIINRNVRNKIYDKFINAYNSRDYDTMYDTFGPLAKAQIDKEDTYETLRQLVDYFDSVVEGGYSHSDYVGSKGDLKHFTLVYSVKFGEKSNFGKSGTFSVTLAIRGNEYEVLGFNLRSE